MPGNTNIALIGWGRPIYNFYKILKKNKNVNKIIILTHPKKKHEKDKKYFDNNKIFYDIFKLGKNLKIIQTEKIDQKIIKILKNQKINLIVSAGSKFIFSKSFIKKYNKNLINFHPSYLPEERGGANFTYRILLKKNYVAATVHYINERIDQGDIIFKTKKKINKLNLTNLFLETYKLYNALFSKFLKYYLENKKLNSLKQNNFNSSYFPKIDSEVDGKIDLSWNGEYIDIFVKAFSRPYKGSYLFEKKTKTKIFIVDSIFKKTKETHPFLYGKVSKINRNGSCDIFCKNGILSIKKISFDIDIIKPIKFLNRSSKLI
ncbi:formyltransferase family protein [Candidatus Pelagibacter sp.]|uniref:formyltransferase family protein n=1 Tax=Candidatus Pelagibacter sp. TaxID=2024849 RepID=UPI003F82B19B